MTVTDLPSTSIVSFINIILHWSDNLFSSPNQDICYNYYIYYIYQLVSLGISTININGLIYHYITLDIHFVNPLNTNNCYINYSYYFTCQSTWEAPSINSSKLWISGILICSIYVKSSCSSCKKNYMYKESLELYMLYKENS